MCIWRVDIADRHCEYCSFFGGCERREAVSDCESVAKECIAAMSAIVGCNILNRRRTQTEVWARNMVAYRLRQRGFTLKEAGEMLGLSHSAVVYGSKQVERMLKSPKMYPREVKIWEKFINSQKI